MNLFVLKLLLNSVVVVPLLYWFTEASFFTAIVTSILLSVVAYILGDRTILRMSNNIIATASDAVLSLMFLGLTALFLNWSLSLWELLTIVALLGVVEFILHPFFKRQENKATD